MTRSVQPELLDDLPPDDPRAIHSRRDLRLLNWLMRHQDIFVSELTRTNSPPHHLAEIGAGDGSLMLKLAQKLHCQWPGVRVTLVDRQKTVAPETLAAFSALGWQAEAVAADAFDWLKSTGKVDALLANLFLHHFKDAPLAELLQLAAARTDLFLACETRRTWPSFAISRFLWLLGCNAVTRNDAVLSMHAGFRDRELTALWPSNGWQLDERGAILFTHLFVARRK